MRDRGGSDLGSEPHVPVDPKLRAWIARVLGVALAAFWAGVVYLAWFHWPF